MKQILALILIVLLLSGTLGPSVLAAEESSVSVNAATTTDSEDTISSSDQVTAPVIAVTSAAITLTSFDATERTDAVAFAVGTSQEELSNWFADVVTGFTGYDADGNPYDLVSVNWSWDGVNTAMPGVYYASTSPDLGTEYTLADGVSLPRQRYAVSIQIPGEPDINCCVAARGFLRFPWVLSAEQQEQLDEFALWLRKDNGEWTNLDDGFWLTSEDMQITQHILTYGSSYELKVTYPGGQTGVLTFQYDGELSILDYSAGDRDGGDAGSSNSGTGTQPAPSDSSSESGGTPQDSVTTPQKEQEPSSVPSEPQEEQDSSSTETEPALNAPQALDSSQNNENLNCDNNSFVQTPVTEKPVTETPIAPTPTAIPVYSDASLPQKAADASPESENHVVSLPDSNAKAVPNPVPDRDNTTPKKISEAQEPATVFESYSPTQTVISGLRLRDFCADEENVVFGSGNLTISIPSSLLLALNLSDSDTLSVKLTQPESNQIMYAVEVSGKVVTKLPGTVLRLRYTPLSEDAQITVQDEAEEPIIGVSYNDKLLRFTADKAGTYTILEAAETREVQKSMSLLLPISGGLLLAVGGITIFRRRHFG